MYYPSNCNEISTHDCGGCEIELGRVRAVAFVHKSYYSTLVAGIEDLNTWNAGRIANKIFVYPDVNGEFNGGSAITGRGFAKAEETLMAYNYEVQFNIPNYEGNIAHWNALRGSRNYYIIFCTETQMHITNRICTIVPRNDIKNDLKQEVIWSCVSKWTSDSFPTIYDKLDDAFSCGLVINNGIGVMIIENTFIVG